MRFKQTDNQDRLEILLAMALTVERHGEASANDGETAASVSLLERISSRLAALSNADLTRVREKIASYEVLSDDEKMLWQARILNRVSNQNSHLDKDVHYTQITEVLRGEPAYINSFILSNLSEETRQNVGAQLAVESGGAHKAINPGLARLLRQRFLRKFVTREDLGELTPLALLSGNEILALIQQLGRSEIALVCRGIQEIENLAPFLRQFPPADAQVIVQEMVKLRTVERKRIERAENLVQEAWQNEADSTLIVQQIGLKKLAAALVNGVECEAEFTMQKLPFNLSKKLKQRLDDLIEPDFAIAAATETETLARSVLLDKMQPAKNAA